MPEVIPFTSDDPRELGIARIIDAPRAIVWRCWTDIDLHKKWFCPKPWFVSDLEEDQRPGGRMRTVMNGPDGERHESIGQYLEIVEGERLVFTDAFVGDWRPSDGPAFMVGVVQLQDGPGGKTLMRWSARHWTEEAKTQHLEMGFEQGWGTCAEQLETLARSILEGSA